MNEKLDEFQLNLDIKLDRFILNRIRAIHAYIHLIIKNLDQSLKKLEEKKEGKKEEHGFLQDLLADFLEELKKEKVNFGEILKQNNYEFQNKKTELIKLKFEKASPSKFSSKKLSNFDIGRLRAINSVLYKYIKRVEIILINSRQKNFDILSEINSLKMELVLEEQQLTHILEMVDLAYQEDRLNELKIHFS